MNYFDLFHFSTSFELDSHLLSARYRELQRAIHPDKFAGGSEQDILLAVQKAAQVNDAYQTLKHPLSRAEHLLSLKGIDINHESTTVKDCHFLMQQMEWREALEEIKSASNQEQRIDELQQSFTYYENTIFDNLSSLLESDLDKDLNQAAELIRKLKFMAKLQDELVRIEDTLFD